MNNATLFKQAHRMTKLTIKSNETYRFKFGQWLIFLKSNLTNSLGITSINQSVAYIPVLEHDKPVYSITLPMTVNKTVQRNVGTYSKHYHIDKYISSFIKDHLFVISLLCMQILFTVIMFNATF